MLRRGGNHRPIITRHLISQFQAPQDVYQMGGVHHINLLGRGWGACSQSQLLLSEDPVPASDPEGPNDRWISKRTNGTSRFDALLNESSPRFLEIPKCFGTMGKRTHRSGGLGDQTCLLSNSPRFGLKGHHRNHRVYRRVWILIHVVHVVQDVLAPGFRP